jgi:hypothetical protein
MLCTSGEAFAHGGVLSESILRLIVDSACSTIPQISTANVLTIDYCLWMRLASEMKLLALDADKHDTSASVSHSEYALFL